MRKGLKNNINIFDMVYLVPTIKRLDPVISKNIRKLIKTKYNSEITNRKIEKIVDKLKSSNGRLNFNDLTTDNFCEYAYNYLHIIDSFYDNGFLETLKMDKEILHDKNINIKIWDQIHVNQMLNRLKAMYELFGSKLLDFVDIPILTNVEFMNLEYEKKVEYFQHCSDKLYSNRITTMGLVLKKKFYIKAGKNLNNYFNQLDNNTQ